MSKRAVFERSRRELALDVSVSAITSSWLWSNLIWKVSQSRGLCQDSDNYGTLEIIQYRHNSSLEPRTSLLKKLEYTLQRLDRLGL